MPTYEVTIRARATFTYVVGAGDEVEAARIAKDGNTYDEPEYVLEDKVVVYVEKI